MHIKAQQCNVPSDEQLYIFTQKTGRAGRPLSIYIWLSHISIHLIWDEGRGTVVERVKLVCLYSLYHIFAGEKVNDFGEPGVHESGLNLVALQSHFVLQAHTVNGPRRPSSTSPFQYSTQLHDFGSSSWIRFSLLFNDLISWITVTIQLLYYF